jgi:hypothetical protein
MPKAGFWAVGGYAISFRRDGHWYADDERVENARIERLFSRHVRADGQGGWVIDVGIDRQSVRVEDTPLVVTSVRGDAGSGLVVCTNDDECEPLDAATLEVGEGDVLYCTVDRGERGRLRARFLRPAYYALASFLEIDASGAAVLRSGGRAWPVPVR